MDSDRFFLQRVSEMNTNPTGTEARVCELIAERQRLGVSKYAKTVSENPLELREWLQNALEECLDQAVYLKRAIEEIDRRHDPVASFMVELSELLKRELPGFRTSVGYSADGYYVVGRIAYDVKGIPYTSECSFGISLLKDAAIESGEFFLMRTKAWCKEMRATHAAQNGADLRCDSCGYECCRKIVSVVDGDDCPECEDRTCPGTMISIAKSGDT